MYDEKKMYDQTIMGELIHIRCLLEGIWLNSKEAKEGVTLSHIEERVRDELREEL